MRKTISLRSDVQYYVEDMRNLKNAYKSTKLFLNMVIHDLRNPANQIKFQIEFALENIQKIIEILLGLNKKR